MARPLSVIAIVTAILVSGAFVARVPAQQPASVQTELLNEVRLLRQSIEALVGTGARVQIVFGRLQLQEQRTEAAAKRLDVARVALTGLNRKIVDWSDQIKRYENIVADTRRKPEELEELQAQLRGTIRELERAEAERARVSTEESDAAGVLNQEQGRWSDLNRQLDDLERMLTPRPQ